MVMFKMRDSVPSPRYSPVCNVLHQWKTSLIPTYRVYRLYDIFKCVCQSGTSSRHTNPLGRERREGEGGGGGGERRGRRGRGVKGGREGEGGGEKRREWGRGREGEGRGGR